MFDIKIEPGKAFDELDHLAAGIADATPLMRSIAAEFESQTEANFEAEGRPAWLGLKPSTIAQRTKHGTWPGRIMQISGQLAASYTSAFDQDSAIIGSNKVYAAIQNLGGKAGRGHKAILPARPQVPITPQGDLQPEAEEAVIGIANDYLRTLCG